MKPIERWGFTVAHAVVALTGFTYFYMRHFISADDPFAVVNHPWQPPILAVHIVAAPAFVLLFGMLLRSHALPKLRGPRAVNRRTGWVSLVGFAATALSGYLLQVATAPAALRIGYWTHMAAGCVFALGYGWHFARGWPLGRERRRRHRARNPG